MTVHDQLGRLYQQFPNAIELAVTSEMFEEFVTTCATLERLTTSKHTLLPPHPIESFGGFAAQRTRLFFKNKPLTVIITL